MSGDVWLLFVLASLPIHLAPGPNNVLALLHGAQSGYRAGHLASLGRYPAYLIIFLFAGFGLGVVLATSATFFIVLKWAGGAYLVWMGARLAAAGLPATAGLSASASGSLRTRIRREFLTAAVNPKAIVFATAFYAQFIDPAQADYAAQFAAMVVVSLSLECVAAGVYALAGARLGDLAARFDLMRWVTRLAGGSLVGFGLLLALARRPQAV